jgi:hypothetical protein
MKTDSCSFHLVLVNLFACYHKVMFRKGGVSLSNVMLTSVLIALFEIIYKLQTIYKRQIILFILFDLSWI